jgi:hypothetical protein
VLNLDYRHDPDSGDQDVFDSEFTDEELSALALAADPDEPLGPDAVPLNLFPAFGAGLLPVSYMPPVMSRGARRWRIPVVLSIVGALFTIDALGLCVTYGHVVGA